MKRDMDLIRSILLWMEEQDTDMFVLQMMPEFDSRETTIGHVMLLISGGFISQSPKGTLRITWEGFEFLNQVRDPEIWKKTKEGAEKVGSWSVKLLADLASGFIRVKATELGLPI